ncbi:unnamed protein product [Lathyrus oleraceus]
MAHLQSSSPPPLIPFLAHLHQPYPPPLASTLNPKPSSSPSPQPPSPKPSSPSSHSPQTLNRLHNRLPLSSPFKNPTVAVTLSTNPFQKKTLISPPSETLTFKTLNLRHNPRHLTNLSTATYSTTTNLTSR